MRRLARLVLEPLAGGRLTGARDPGILALLAGEPGIGMGA
jgi:hypothetical protein